MEPSNSSEALFRILIALFLVVAGTAFVVTAFGDSEAECGGG